MNILCRLGWHRWKPCIRLWTLVGSSYHVVAAGGWLAFLVGHKCTRCGKRRSV